MIGTQKFAYAVAGKIINQVIVKQRLTKVEDRKNILSEKRLSFNCTGVKYRAAECCSKRTYKIYKINIIRHFANSLVQRWLPLTGQSYIL